MYLLSLIMFWSGNYIAVRELKFLLKEEVCILFKNWWLWGADSRFLLILLPIFFFSDFQKSPQVLICCQAVYCSDVWKFVELDAQIWEWYVFIAECVSDASSGGRRHPPGVQGRQQSLDTVVSIFVLQAKYYSVS